MQQMSLLETNFERFPFWTIAELYIITLAHLPVLFKKNVLSL